MAEFIPKIYDTERQPETTYNSEIDLKAEGFNQNG